MIWTSRNKRHSEFALGMLDDLLKSKCSAEYLRFCSCRVVADYLRDVGEVCLAEKFERLSCSIESWLPERKT